MTRGKLMDCRIFPVISTLIYAPLVFLQKLKERRKRKGYKRCQMFVPREAFGQIAWVAWPNGWTFSQMLEKGIYLLGEFRGVFSSITNCRIVLTDRNNRPLKEIVIPPPLPRQDKL